MAQSIRFVAIVKLSHFNDIGCQLSFHLDQGWLAPLYLNRYDAAPMTILKYFFLLSIYSIQINKDFFHSPLSLL